MPIGYQISPGYVGKCWPARTRAAAIADYLGTSANVEHAFCAFASAYADQNEHDHAELARAVADGSIPSALGWA